MKLSDFKTKIQQTILDVAGMVSETQKEELLSLFREADDNLEKKKKYDRDAFFIAIANSRHNNILNPIVGKVAEVAIAIPDKILSVVGVLNNDVSYSLSIPDHELKWTRANLEKYLLQNVDQNIPLVQKAQADAVNDYSNCYYYVKQDLLIYLAGTNKADKVLKVVVEEGDIANALRKLNGNIQEYLDGQEGRPSSRDTWDLQNLSKYILDKAKQDDVHLKWIREYNSDPNNIDGIDNYISSINFEAEMGADSQIKILKKLEQITAKNSNHNLTKAFATLRMQVLKIEDWVKDRPIAERKKCSVAYSLYEHDDANAFETLAKDLVNKLKSYRKSIIAPSEQRQLIIGVDDNDRKGLIYTVEQLRQDKDKTPAQKYAELLNKLLEVGPQITQDDETYNEQHTFHKRNSITKGRLQNYCQEAIKKIVRSASPLVQDAIKDKKADVIFPECLEPIVGRLSNYGVFHRSHRKEQNDALLEKVVKTKSLDLKSVEKIAKIYRKLCKLQDLLTAEDDTTSLGCLKAKGGKIWNNIQESMREIEKEACENEPLLEEIKRIKSEFNTLTKIQDRGLIKSSSF